MPMKIPPSTITCSSPAILREELAAVQEKLSVPETEETWEEIATAVMRLGSLSSGNASYAAQEIITCVRSLSRPLNSALGSERTRLSGMAVDLFTTLSAALSSSFEPLVLLFVPTLLSLCTRTNKVFLNRARNCILAIIERTHSPTILPLLAESARDKSASLRLSAAEGILACLSTLQPAVLDKEPRVALIEGVIRTTAKDANADVRKIARKIFEAYQVLFPRRVEKFADPLTPTMKKYLSIKTSTAPQSRPHSSQSTYSDSETTMKPTLSHSASGPTEAFKAGPSRPTVPHSRSLSSTSSTKLTGTVEKHSKPSLTSGVDKAKLAGGTVKQVDRPRRNRTDMGPPKDIPSRAAVVGPTSRQRTLSTQPGAVGQTDRAQRTAAMTTTASRSRSSDSRMESTTAEVPHEGPTKLSGAHHNAGHLGQHKGGPLRPVIAEELAPSRSSRDQSDKAGRVVGGARRVLVARTEENVNNRQRSRSQSHEPAQPSEGSRSSSPAALDGRPEAQLVNVTKLAAHEKAKVKDAHLNQRPKTKSQARIARNPQTAGGGIGRSAVAKTKGHTNVSERAGRTANMPKHAPAADVQLAAAVPLPASREGSPQPVLIPLPPSPQLLPTNAAPVTPRNSHRTAFSGIEQTPISALVASIEQGFLFTPGPNHTLRGTSPISEVDEEEEHVPVFAATVGLRVRDNGASRQGLAGS